LSYIILEMDITILTAVLGSSISTVFFTKIFDYYIDQRSYKKDKLHDNRIAEVKNFYKSYYFFKLELETYLEYTLSSTHDIEKTKFHSQNSVNLLKDFQYQSMIIKLFLNQTDYEEVKNLEKILIKIKVDIDQFHLAKHWGNEVVNLGNRVREIKEVELEKKVPELMNGIEQSLRKTFT
jgi:hypothetical protein